MKKLKMTIIAALAMSTFAVAGGDIAPVEPEVNVPEVVSTPGAFYLGVAYSYIKADGDVTGSMSNSVADINVSGTAEADWNAVMFQAGYQFNPYLAVEGRYWTNVGTGDRDGRLVNDNNASMVITGGGKPIDGGKVLKDGKRLFGDHKTWNGLIKGPLYIGIPISIVVFIIFLLLWPLIEPIPVNGVNQGVYIIYNDTSYYEYYFIGGTFPIGFLSLIIRIVLCAFGGAFGDLFGSFLKRRFDIESGAPFWVIDQLDFALMSILFISIASLIAPGFFRIPDIHIFFFIMIITPSISILGNNVAWLAGFKEVPW